MFSVRLLRSVWRGVAHYPLPLSYHLGRHHSGADHLWSVQAGLCSNITVVAPIV